MDRYLKMMNKHQQIRSLAAGLVTLALCTTAALGQQQASPLAVAYTYPCNAGAGEFFDAATLQCGTCDAGAGFFPVPDGLGCALCDPTAGREDGFANGFALSASWEPAALSSGRCACANQTAPNRAVALTDSGDGRRYARCVVCGANATADAAAGACVPAGGGAAAAAAGATPDSDLAYVVAALNARGAGIGLQTATQATIQGVNEAAGGAAAYVIPASAPLARLLGPAARACMDGGDRAGCGAVANLCALQLYAPNAAACVIYDELVAAAATNQPRRAGSGGSASTTSAAPARPDTGALPWLYYGPGYDPAAPAAAADVGVTVSFARGAAPPRFVLAAYSLAGEWLGVASWTAQLQLCGGGAGGGYGAAAWARFGADYTAACELSAGEVLAAAGLMLRQGSSGSSSSSSSSSSGSGGTGSSSTATTTSSSDYDSGGTRVYEAFIERGDGALYPLPVRVDNFGGGRPGYVRRFFLADASLATPSEGGGRGGGGSGGGGGSSAAAAAAGPRAVVYAASLRLEVTARGDARDQILPPVLTVRYEAMQLLPQEALFGSSSSSSSGSSSGSNSATATAPPPPPRRAVAFTVEYRNAPSTAASFWSAWRTLLAVVLVLGGGPVWALRVARFLRVRGAAAPLDAEALLFAALAGADALSGALAAALAAVALYWLAVARLQQRAHALAPAADELHDFWVALALAVAGQGAALLWTLYRQATTDVFFIDWEKPRRVLANGGAAEAPAPVSAWRALLAANEWQELQTSARATAPAFTAAAAALLLDGARLAPGAGLGGAPPLGPTQSALPRLGAAVGWLAVLGAAQWLWDLVVARRLGGGRASDRYVDLLHLANVSAVVLDARTGGWYLHGRNHMAHADATLADLNAALLREGEGLAPRRGLVTAYAGSSTGGGGGGAGSLFGAASSAAALNDNQAFALFIPEDLRRLYESTLLSHVAQAAADQRLARGALTGALKGPPAARGDGAMAASRRIAAAFAAAVDEAERGHATQVVVPTFWQRLLRMPPAGAGSGSKALLIHDLDGAWTRVALCGIEGRLFLFEGLLFCAVDAATRCAPAAALATLGAWLVLRALRRRLGRDSLAAKTLIDRRFLI